MLNVEPPSNLDLLVHSLQLCGRRWPLGRMFSHPSVDIADGLGRLHKVVQAAIAEREIGGRPNSLPPQFFDLQYLHLDIDKDLTIWAEGSA